MLAGLPRHVLPVLDVALAKDPRDRFADASRFLEALEDANAAAKASASQRLLPPEDVVPRTVRSRGCRRGECG